VKHPDVPNRASRQRNRDPSLFTQQEILDVTCRPWIEFNGGEMRLPAKEIEFGYLDNKRAVFLLEQVA
jgi:hypothetical protein